jgi:hypothetical protein
MGTTQVGKNLGFHAKVVARIIKLFRMCNRQSIYTII